MDSQASEINARLAKLERENRRMKKIGIVAIVFASVLFISGQAKTNKVVEANEFRLVDGSGKVRGTLMTTESGETDFLLSDPVGKNSALLRAGPKVAVLSLINPDEGAISSFATAPFGGLLLKSQSESITMTAHESGRGPNLTVVDKEGYSSILGRSDLLMPNTGKKEQRSAASLVLFDKDKKVLWAAP
jgi:hypothetical protein